MEAYHLKIASGYDPDRQRSLGLFAASLDDQLSKTKKFLGAMTIAELEWQSSPGMNTIGMLLAHNALVEVFWMSAAGMGISWGPESDKRIREIICIGGEEDGMPLDADGKHPEALLGKNLDDYLRMLDSARAATHDILSGWTDDSLDESYSMQEQLLSRGWTLYHVLEHYICHYGQIRIIRRMIKDRGVV